MSTWQGRCMPPYEVAALPLISGITGELTGNFRAMVKGAETTFWDGTRGRSSTSSGTIYTSRLDAIAEAERWIHKHTDGLLDLALFAIAELPNSGDTAHE